MRVGGAAAPPTVLSAIVNPVGNDNQLTIEFSTAVTGFGAGNGGFALLDDSLNDWLFFGTVVSGEGTNTVILWVDGGFPPLGDRALTLSYTPGVVESLSGLPLAAFSGFPVVNNET